METETIQVKIKLSSPESATSYIQLQEKWENEGGAISIADQDGGLPDLKLPFLPGEHLRVVEGHVDFTGNQLYYEVTVERITKSKTV
jgi:hypothetical protein